MIKIRNLIIFFILSAGIFACRSISDTCDLSGEWSFALDPDDVGVSEKWFNKALAEKILLPGSLQSQGYGDDVDTDTHWTGQVVDSSWFTAPRYEKYRQKGNIKIPFWLQADKLYVGVAWYQREIDIPASWKNKHIELELERTQSNWNGIIGNINLSAKPVYYIDDVRIYPDVKNHKASVVVEFAGKPQEGRQAKVLQIH